MRLIECYIENFGMLHACSYKFENGLNSIYRENGTGKTTLTVFIKAMLYGMDESRKRDLDENDRKKYLPWQGGRYGGSLTVSLGGKIYRIERSFGTKPADDELRIIDAASGAVCADIPESVGEYALGIDRAGFERTVFLSEKSLSGSIENASIAAKLSELVGSDGDIGEYERAKDRLEERRKEYLKRGNTGLIPEMKAKIAEVESQISALERVRGEALGMEGRLLTLEGEIKRLEDSESAIISELGTARDAAAARSERAQYSAMLEELNREESMLGELQAFFADGVPSSADIDAVRDGMIEAARLKKESGVEESEELSALKRFFTRNTDFAEIDRIKRAYARADEADAELAAVKRKLEHGCEALADELGGSIPASDEVRAYAIRAGKRGSGLPYLACGTALGILSVVGGIFMPITFLALIAAIPLLAFGIFKQARRGDRAAMEFAHSLGISGDVRAELDALADRLLAHERTADADRAAMAERQCEAAECRRAAEEYVSYYPHNRASVVEALSFIESSYGRYYALLTSAGDGQRRRADAELRISFLLENARKFLEKYGISPDARDPFEELRVRVNSYSFAKSSVERQRNACKQFEAMHPSIAVTIQDTAETKNASELESRLDEVRAALVRARREHAYAEREYNEAMSRCERMDELTAMREGYLERLGIYEERYEVIIRTLELLHTASDNITSRYIGGTKERFEHYLSLMGGASGDYSLDRSFVVKKNERGATRDTESYSRGTRDLIALSLRLALVDALFDGKCPFIILDDPFTALDTRRIEDAKSLIRELAREKQVLYFTCSEERRI